MEPTRHPRATMSRVAARVVVGLLVLACGAPATPAAPAGGAAASPTPSTAIPSTTTTIPPGTRQRSPSPPPSITGPEPSDALIAVGEDERRVLLYLPERAPSRPSPLVVFLHPAGGTPTLAAEETHLDRLASTDGAIVAFPPARGRLWQAQVTPGLTDSDGDERYLQGMIDALAEQYPVDPDRIFVAGFSMGAVMAGRLACRLADRVAAAVIVSGAAWIGDCRPSRPVSILVVHGTGDTTFRFAGAERLVDTWRRLDDCAPAAAPVEIGAGANLTAADCADGTAVDFVSVDNGWHTWFKDPDASELARRFFAGHARE